MNFAKTREDAAFFSRLFRRKVALSPSSQVRWARRSCPCAHGVDRPHEAIAHQVGQKDAAFFSRRFRRKVNLSPARYRKWEQGRTRPTGPARALLRIVEKDPKAMLTLHAA